MENQNDVELNKEMYPSAPIPFSMKPSNWMLVAMVFLYVLLIALNGFNSVEWHGAVKVFFFLLELIGLIFFIACKLIMDREWQEYVNEKNEKS